jgi:hypothetical protein
LLPPTHQMRQRLRDCGPGCRRRSAD